MKVAIGLKAHSGWAALVVIGNREGEFVVIDRCRLELVEEEWAKQPYHAAEELEGDAARDVVKQGIASAYRLAEREMQVVLKREQQRGNQVTACSVLVSNPMSGWSIDEILAVHFRMHKAEGVLFRDALVQACKSCQIPFVTIPEKELTNYAEKALKTKPGDLAKMIAMLGKAAGPPWSKDQKESALAAIVALRDRTK